MELSIDLPRLLRRGKRSCQTLPPDVAPIAGIRDQSSESYESLSRLIGSTQTALACVDTPSLPAGWTIVRHLPNVQMVWQGPSPPVTHNFEDLDKGHIDQMLALTQLNQLGRFRRRAPELGSYVGILESGRLVAMAGEGFHFPGYTEISAVCTHPDHRGHGYASTLVSTLVQSITKRSETPFLHVAKDNVDAIRLYEKLGFKTRRAISFVIVKKEAA